MRITGKSLNICSSQMSHIGLCLLVKNLSRKAPNFDLINTLSNTKIKFYETLFKFSIANDLPFIKLTLIRENLLTLNKINNLKLKFFINDNYLLKLFFFKFMYPLNLFD